MRLALQILGYIAAFCLQVMILQSMRHGAWRRYPLLFVYVVADLLTNLIELRPTLMIESLSKAEQRQFSLIYYWDETIIQAILFLLVISLIYRASTDVRARRMLLAALVCGSILFALISLALHYDPNVIPGKWMNRWTRDMNFCAAILDLMLWATLIRTRQKDSTTLMISGGLGIHFTAGAIGQALRDLTHSSVDVTSVIMVSANLACLYIWWQALRVSPGTGRPSASASLPLHK